MSLKPTNGHISRAPQAALGQDVVAAERHQVVAGHDRRDVGQRVEQLAAQAAPSASVKASPKATSRRGPARRLHRVREAEVALMAGREVLGPTEVCDAGVPEGGQVLDGQADPAAVVAATAGSASSPRAG